MNENTSATSDRDAVLDTLAAELTRAAYDVALRYGAAATWLDLELGLWHTLGDMVKQWGRTGRSAVVRAGDGPGTVQKGAGRGGAL
jgi:hypothetical protein